MPTLAPPATLASAVGRDQSPTFTWRDADDRLHWLGRTTMPRIRAEALVESFHPGTGNVLIHGIGNGAEVRRLLDRLQPYQAVFVIEEEPWQAELAQKLHDFSLDLGAGRFVLLTGETAWDAYAEFCREHPGYLVAERILAWPWFRPDEGTRLSQCVSTLNAASEDHRAQKYRARAQQSPNAPTRAIAVLSAVSDPAVHALADALSEAAAELALPVLRFVRDNPAGIHPYHVESALLDSPPKLAILIDTPPAALLHPHHAATAVVLCSHTTPLDADWLRAIPNDVLLMVRNEAQHSAAIAAGRPPDRVVCLAPAVRSQPATRDRATSPSTSRPLASDRLAILADFPPITAEAAGLHLGSHNLLWKAATAILEEEVDRYDDSHADRTLRTAENRTGIRLTSDEVRAGLVSRIRTLLAPVIVRRAYCRALIRAGYEIEIYGHGRADDLAEHSSGLLPREPPNAAAVIALDPTSGLPAGWLEAAAAGVPVWIRAASPLPSLTGILDPQKHYARFTTRDSLLQLAKQRQSRRADFDTGAAAAARHLHAHHTWTHRLRQLFALVGLAIDA